MTTWDAFSLIWLDPNIDEIQLINDKFRSIAKDIKKLNTIQQCQAYLSQISANDRIIFIVSGQLGRQLVPEIHQLNQIISIYVFCMDELANRQWTSRYRKVNL